MGIRGGRATASSGAPFKVEHSLSCLHCKGEGNLACKTSLLSWKSPKQHGNRAILSFPYICLCKRAHQTDTWPCRLCSWGCSLQATPGEEDSSARLRTRSFLQAVSSEHKAVDWLLLNARKSWMCQAHAARERHMHQAKDPCGQQQVAAGLPLPVGCHAAPQCWLLQP